MVAHADRHVAKVGGKTDLDSFGAEGKADGIGRVVRDGEGLDVDIADAETAAGEEMLGLGEAGTLPSSLWSAL